MRSRLSRLGLARFAALFAIFIFAASTVSAQPLPSPTGTPILEITGRIAVTNGDARARFDLAMLEALGVSRTKTTTAWTNGQQDFEGVNLKALLDRVGAFGDRIEAIALNDYKVEIPISDFARWPVVLAYRMNGELMRVRDKGPLWIVYPQDDFPALNTKETQGKWAWQVKELRVR
jgi:hypothetical protein